MSVTELSLADLLVALSHEDNHYDAWNELLRRDEARDLRIGELESQLADAKRNEERAVGELKTRVADLDSLLDRSMAVAKRLKSAAFEREAKLHTLEAAVRYVRDNERGGLTELYALVADKECES